MAINTKYEQDLVEERKQEMRDAAGEDEIDTIIKKSKGFKI